jgi:hypothetical protein
MRVRDRIARRLSSGRDSFDRHREAERLVSVQHGVARRFVHLTDTCTELEEPFLPDDPMSHRADGAARAPIDLHAKQESVVAYFERSFGHAERG